MPRIRTIKPEFWADEKLAPLAPIDRLVFLGLISMADDCGRVLGNLKAIDAFIFPETDDSARESLARLSRMARVRFGKTASGQSVLQIMRWTDHQKVDHPNHKGALPEIVEEQELPFIREALARDSRGAREPLATLSVPTTNDQRPTTVARKRISAPSDSWVTEAGDLWREAIGLIPYGQIGKALKPAVSQYGWDDGNPKGQHVKRWLSVYLDARPYTRRDGSIWGDLPTDNDENAPPRDTRFCSPADFVKNLATWRARCAPLAGAA